MERYVTLNNNPTMGWWDKYEAGGGVVKYIERLNMDKKKQFSFDKIKVQDLDFPALKQHQYPRSLLLPSLFGFNIFIVISFFIVI